jgi:ABC-type multidrug transport system ATPase subunit
MELVIESLTSNPSLDTYVERCYEEYLKELGVWEILEQDRKSYQKVSKGTKKRVRREIEED